MLRAKKRFSFATRTGSEMAVMRGPFGSIIMIKINFKVKGAFYSEIGGHVLTPDFGTYQGRVLQRRKGSSSHDRWIWRGGRVPQLKILLTEEEEIDQIFWLRFGKSYFIFRNRFYSLE